MVEDNAFISAAIGGFDVADVNFDGSISGDGTDPPETDDVSAFVQGWKYENLVNGVRVGDLTSRRNGDLNFDGRPEVGAATQDTNSSIVVYVLWGELPLFEDDFETGGTGAWSQSVP